MQIRFQCGIPKFLHVFLALLHKDTKFDDYLLTYFNVWTKNNDILSVEHILELINSSRIAVIYEYLNATEVTCLSTAGLAWQDSQTWTMRKCAVTDNMCMLDIHKPIDREEYIICDIL